MGQEQPSDDRRESGDATDGDAARRPLQQLADFEPLARRRGGFDPIVGASTLAMNLLALALPLAVLQIYDKIGTAQSLETLSFLSVGLVIVALLEFSLRYAQSCGLAVAAQRLGYGVTIEAVERRLSDPELDRKGESAAVLMEKFRALDTITAFVSGDQQRDLIDLPFSIVFLVAILMIGGPLVLAPVLVIAAAWTTTQALLRRSKRAADKADSGARRQADFMGEVFGGNLTVKGLGAEPLMLRRFERLIAGSADTFRQNFMAASDIQVAANVFSVIGVVATVSAGAVMVVLGDLTPGGLAACSLLSSRAIQPIVRSVAAVTERDKALVAAETARGLFEGPPPSPALTGLAAQAPRLGPRRPARVEARRVSFAGESGAILDEASFELPTGGLTMVSSASNPATLSFLRLVAGLARPEDGALEIDGLPAHEARQGGGGEVALVTANTRLFRGSIIENLTLFGSLADMEDALWAARIMGVDTVVGELPEGYDTIVSRGAADTLSQTHLRLLIIARALAQRPRLLLLERPQLYLDGQAERRLLAALGSLKGETTMVVGGDRPDIAEIADRRLELRDGWLLDAAEPGGETAQARKAAEGGA